MNSFFSRKSAINMLRVGVLTSGLGLLGMTVPPAIAQTASGGGSGGGAIQGGDGAPGGGVGIPGSLQNGTSAWGIGESTTPDVRGYADDGEDRGYVARSRGRQPAY